MKFSSICIDLAGCPIGGWGGKLPRLPPPPPRGDATEGDQFWQKSSWSILSILVNILNFQNFTFGYAFFNYSDGKIRCFSILIVCVDHVGRNSRKQFPKTVLLRGNNHRSRRQILPREQFWNFGSKDYSSVFHHRFQNYLGWCRPDKWQAFLEKSYLFWPIDFWCHLTLVKSRSNDIEWPWLCQSQMTQMDI